MKKNEILFEMLRKMAVLKAADVSKERLKLYCDVLVRFDVNDVKTACNKLACENKFFPDISEFVTLLKPTLSVDDKANEVSGEIIGAIKRFGVYNAIDAKEYLGEKIWEVVNLTGGWASLCNSNISGLNTLRAQIRDLAKSKIKENPLAPILPKQLAESQRKAISDKENINQPSISSQ